MTASPRFRKAAIFATLISIAVSAQADTLDGTWAASSLRVSWSVGDWSKECGPKPSGGAEAGGTVTLQAFTTGFKLTGLGRNYSTHQCWEQMPGLLTRSKSTSNSAYQTTCSMPAGDPRRANITTSWRLTGDTIQFDETGQYQLVISGSSCTASVRRTRTLHRQQAPSSTKTTTKIASQAATLPTAKPAASKSELASSGTQQLEALTAAPPPKPEQANHCLHPGRPIQLEVTPRTKLMRPGETFQFSALARDARGCRVAVAATWQLLGKVVGARLSSSGELSVLDNAPSSKLEIVATVGAQPVSVGAQIVSNEEYEALLEGGNYGILGESVDGAEITLASGHVELGEVIGRPTQSRAYLLALLGLLMSLLGLALYLIRRHQISHKSAHKKPSLGERTAARSYTETARKTLPEAPQALKVQTPLQQHHPETTEQARLCPLCGKRYQQGTLYCSEDGARLMRAN